MTDENETNPETATADAKKKLHWLEIGYFSSQIMLAIIGVWALCIYHGQLTAMQGQLDQMSKQSSEIQKQTDLMHQQLVGTQAAIIEASSPNISNGGEISLTLCNRGHVLGHATPHFVISRVLTNGQINDVFEKTETGQPITDQCKLFSYYVPWLASPEWKDISSRETNKQALVFKGNYVWDDGFGDSYTTPFCYSWMITRGYVIPNKQTVGIPGQLMAGFSPCWQWQSARNNYKDQLQKAQNSNP